jgi:hypothetical protein
MFEICNYSRHCAYCFWVSETYLIYVMLLQHHLLPASAPLFGFLGVVIGYSLRLELPGIPCHDYQHPAWSTATKEYR